jgi:hypothetical protein
LPKKLPRAQPLMQNEPRPKAMMLTDGNLSPPGGSRWD